MNETMHTYFAPANRVSATELQEQRNHFIKNPLICNILNAFPSLVLVLNKERQIVYCNNIINNFIGDKGADSILGLRPGELLNCQHASENDGGCGTTEFCRTCGAVNAIIKSQLGKPDSQECRIIQSKTLDALDLNVLASPFNVNNYHYTIFAVTDISNEKRRKTLERIFFHDILNTAGGLKGIGDLLKDATPEEIIEFRDIIVQLSDNLIEEIEAQREFAAAENGDLEPEYSNFDSLDLINEITNVYNTHDAGKNKFIKIDPNSINISLFNDKILVRRVLGNLIKNALEASNEGDVITIGATLPIPGSIQFWVHNKMFIQRNHQLQIFQRSFSTKGSGRGTGTYSIKLLSEKYLKGNVSFVSTPENGTAFYVTIPLSLQ
jgi:K+-sensing histidine kinase KdpD